MSAAPSSDSYEVIVAGAGPAGVAAALAAVRAEPSLRGRVLLIDRARFPRGKPCGGGLTGHVEEAMAALGLELRVPSFPSPTGVVRYGSRVREVELPRPVRTVRREEFDASLVEQAREQGCVVREGEALLGYAVDGAAGEVRVRTAAGERRARVLIGADGAGSLVRKALGREGCDDDGGETKRGRPIRLFRAELPDPGWRRAEMLYDFTPMRDGLRGYLWIFPVPGGRINVGLMHWPAPDQPKTGAELAELLRARLADHGISLGDAPLRGWPIWGYQAARPVSAPHVLTVGDAAGVDALTGEGIAVGLEHGLVAGQAVRRALATGDFRFRGYRRALRRAAVGRDLWLDGILAHLLYGGAWGARGDHRQWLSLVLCDERMLGLYAARVSGTLVLADQWGALVSAWMRHLARGKSRRRQLREAEGVARSA